MVKAGWDITEGISRSWPMAEVKLSAPLVRASAKGGLSGQYGKGRRPWRAFG